MIEEQHKINKKVSEFIKTLQKKKSFTEKTCKVIIRSRTGGRDRERERSEMQTASVLRFGNIDTEGSTFLCKRTEPRIKGYQPATPLAFFFFFSKKRQGLGLVSIAKSLGREKDSTPRAGRLSQVEF